MRAKITEVALRNWKVFPFRGIRHSSISLLICSEQSRDRSPDLPFDSYSRLSFVFLILDSFLLSFFLSFSFSLFFSHNVYDPLVVPEQHGKIRSKIICGYQRVFFVERQSYQFCLCIPRMCIALLKVADEFDVLETAQHNKFTYSYVERKKGKKKQISSIIGIIVRLICSSFFSSGTRSGSRCI